MSFLSFVLLKREAIGLDRPQNYPENKSYILANVLEINKLGWKESRTKQTGQSTQIWEKLPHFALESLCQSGKW